MEKLVKRYKFENGQFVMRLGAHAGSVVSEEKVAQELQKEGTSYKDVDSALETLQRECSRRETQSEDLAERVTDILDRQDFIKDFRYITVGSSSLLYHFKDGRAENIQVGYPNSKDWVDILLKYANEEVIDLKNQLAPILYSKNPFSMSPEDAARLISNRMDFSRRQDLKQTLPEDVKPVSLTTSDEISLCKVPFVFDSNPQLNPTMADFLSRVSDHEYLCAITWLLFNGQKSPYVVYLYGTGGEGKSSFLNVIAKQVGTSAAFSNDSRHANYHMYGKAMIVLTENTDCFLLQNQSVKQITGNSLVNCEQKNKGAFTASLSGTLYADANKMLKLKGEDAEFRRLRIFKVKKPGKIELLDMKTYEKLLAENFNSFLNYCRQCFEKVGSKTAWLVPASPGQTADFKALTDKGFINNSEQVLVKIFKDLGLEYNKDGVVDASLFWKAYYRLPESKEKYLADTVRDYLFLHKQVSEVGDYIFGLQQKPSNHTSFVLPTT